MAIDENMRFYREALQKDGLEWGQIGRAMDYAGSGVGLVRERKYAKEIMDEVKTGCPRGTLEALEGIIKVVVRAA